MLQSTILLCLVAVGLGTLVGGLVRRSRRDTARSTPGHLRNVHGPHPRHLRLHHRAKAEQASSSIRPADERL